MQHQLGVLSCGGKKSTERHNFEDNDSCINVTCWGGFGELKFPTCLIHSLWHRGIVAFDTVLSQAQRIETFHWVIPSGPVEHNILQVVAPWPHTHTHTKTSFIITVRLICLAKDNIVSTVWYSLHWWWKWWWWWWWWWDDGDLCPSTHLMEGWWMSQVLTALQLQGAHLSVHGVLGQVHVAGDCRCDAVMCSEQVH